MGRDDHYHQRRQPLHQATEIAANAGQWANCHTRDGRKAYGVPGLYYLTDMRSCTCPDAPRHPGRPCKHQLAVRLHVELVKAQQRKGVRAA